MVKRWSCFKDLVFADRIKRGIATPFSQSYPMATKTLADLQPSPVIILLDAIAAQLEQLSARIDKPGVAGRVRQRRAIAIRPLSSRYREYADGTLRGNQQSGQMGILQWEALEFELAAIVVDGADDRAALELIDNAMQLLIGWQPYAAMRTGFQGVSRGITTKDGDSVREITGVISCELPIFNGTPPDMVENPFDAVP